MLAKEFYEKATTNATAGESGKVLDMGLAEKLLKEKVKTLTPVSVEDIEESNKEDGTSNITQSGFYFVLSYVMNRTLARYF